MPIINVLSKDNTKKISNTVCVSSCVQAKALQKAKNN